VSSCSSRARTHSLSARSPSTILAQNPDADVSPSDLKGTEQFYFVHGKRALSEQSPADRCVCVCVCVFTKMQSHAFPLTHSVSFPGHLSRPACLSAPIYPPLPRPVIRLGRFASLQLSAPLESSLAGTRRKTAALSESGAVGPSSRKAEVTSYWSGEVQELRVFCLGSAVAILFFVRRFCLLSD